MILLLSSGILICYTLRVNISVAAQKMRDDLGWTENQKGSVLSAFYVGYACGQIPAARWAQVYGARRMFGLSILIPSILTLLVPLACKQSFVFALLIRSILGLFESSCFPAVYSFFPKWIPLKEKTIMVATTMSGIYLGEIIGFSFSGYLIQSNVMIGGVDFGGWSSVFYFFGMVGVLWYPLWCWLAYEDPNSHPYITPEEIALIADNKNYTSLRDYELSDDATGDSPIHGKDVLHVNQSTFSTSHVTTSDPILNSDFHSRNEDEEESLLSTNLLPPSRSHSTATPLGDFASRTPWKSFFTNPISLTLLVNNWTFGFVGFLLLSEMPSYLTDVLGFDLTTSGLLCIVPYASLFITSLGFGFTFDYLQKKYHWSTRTVRQVAMFIGLGLSSTFLIICGYVNNAYLSFFMMVLSQAMLGACQSGIACAYLDVSPNFSSVLNTVGNTFAAIAGIVGPLVVSLFISSYKGMLGWRYVFILTFIMSAISLILWAIFQTSDIVSILNTPLPKKTRK